MLGADGVLMGTRFWAATEAAVKDGHRQAILRTGGDGTLRTRIPDIVRQLPWPAGFTARIRRNVFTARWHGREEELQAVAADEGARYRQAAEAGDPEQTAVWFGEAAGLVHAIEPAAVIVERVVEEAAARLRTQGGAQAR
jgi:nitronate monooxygenase